MIYQVYRKLVELDLENYGLQCKFIDVDVPETLFKRDMKSDYEDGSVWDNVKRSYWSCPTYYHPEIKFIDF